MMRNWFILFATTFTITTLTLTITTWFVPYISTFNSQYIILLFISSVLISFYVLLFNQFPIDNIFLSIFIDIMLIFVIVYGTGIVIKSIPVDLFNFFLVLSLVIVIYIVIMLIYMSILKKESEDMNEKISKWRKKNAGSKTSK